MCSYVQPCAGTIRTALRSHVVAHRSLPRLRTAASPTCFYGHARRTLGTFHGIVPLTTLPSSARDGSYRRRNASSATSLGNYFHPNLPNSVERELADKKRVLDFEKNWAAAHRRVGNPEEEVSKPEANSADQAAAPLQDRLRAEKARLANAQLNLDGDDRSEANSSACLNQYGFRDLVVRCTTFDAQGDVQSKNETVAKSTLCTQNGVQPRDLRKIDSGATNTIPQILVRREAILINILHIRMLVKANTVILFDAIGTHDSQIQEQFLRELSVSLKLGYRNSGGMPYEFRALEAALASITTALEEEMRIHMSEVSKLVGRLETHIVAQELHGLLHYSRRLAAFQRRAKSVLTSIDEVLEQDDDLSAMYLSESAVRPRDQDDHQEVEMLLENFSKQLEAIVAEVDSKVADLHQTQDVIELILDTSRNALLTFDLQASIGTLGLASGAFIAGLFGMNLHSSLEAHPYAFWMTTGMAAALVTLVTVGGLRRVYSIRKIGLGQGSFGEYAPVSRQGVFAGRRGPSISSDALGGGRKALYYDKARKTRRDRGGQQYR